MTMLVLNNLTLVFTYYINHLGKWKQEKMECFETKYFLWQLQTVCPNLSNQMQSVLEHI